MDLNVFDIVHAKEGLRAAVSARGTMSDCIDSTRQSASLNRPWISAGRSLGLKVFFTFEGAPLQGYASNGTAIVHLQEALENAQLWSQLCLELTHLAPHHLLKGEYSSASRSDWIRPKAGSTPTIQMLLQPVHQTAVPGKPSSRILNGTPFNDIKPPSSIASITMPELEIFISLQRLSKQAARGRRGSKRVQQITIDDEAMLEDAEQCELLPVSPLPSLRNSGPSRPYVSSTNKTQSVLIPSTATLTAFLDAALRGTIHPRPTRLTAGLKLHHQPSTTSQSLATAAPALWTPTYLAAVAERACYISRLSRSLTQFLTMSKGPKAAALRTRVAGSGETVLHSCDVRLWEIVTAGMERGDAARRLRPLRAVNGRDAGGLMASEDEMLVEDTGVERSRSVKDEDEVEDLFGAESGLGLSQDSGYGSQGCDVAGMCLTQDLEHDMVDGDGFDETDEDLFEEVHRLHTCHDTRTGLRRGEDWQSLPDEVLDDHDTDDTLLE
ncbi:hypothetical protein FH972_026607 [Carpinus fangiana]|uniref:Uncharacterized protein n=1 Tax=Carpinus fangiana TaxID=176857 RepID=A0A5N6L4I2_9ROSI|nr:hypothetical protein FH972_026607 [Carpinus fangiana]